MTCYVDLTVLMGVECGHVESRSGLAEARQRPGVGKRTVVSVKPTRAQETFAMLAAQSEGPGHQHASFGASPARLIAPEQAMPTVRHVAKSGLHPRSTALWKAQAV